MAANQKWIFSPIAFITVASVVLPVAAQSAFRYWFCPLRMTLGKINVVGWEMSSPLGTTICLFNNSSKCAEYITILIGLKNKIIYTVIISDMWSAVLRSVVSMSQWLKVDYKTKIKIVAKKMGNVNQILNEALLWMSVQSWKDKKLLIIYMEIEQLSIN